jgi:hypothetical protein
LKHLSALDKDEFQMSLTSASVPIVQDQEDNTRAANEV